MKIQYKLSVLIFLLILVSSVTNYQLLIQTFQTLQIKRLESAEALLGKTLAQKMYRMVIENQKEATVALLFKEKILREKKLRYLVVTDRQGELFAHTYLSDVPQDVLNLRNDFEVEQQYRIEDLLQSNLGIFNIGVPIREGIIQVGTLHIGIDKGFIDEAISPLKRASKQTLVFGLFVVVVGAAMAYLASYAITSSLTKLSEWAFKLSKGDYSAEIDIKANDEVGHLASSFLQMRDKIQDAHTKLERQNLNLEELVRERTRELEGNYEQLKELHADLDEQRKNLKVVFSAMKHPLYVINRDYTIAMMNDQAKRLLRADMPYPPTCHALSHRSEKPCQLEDHPCPLPIVTETKQPVILEHVHYDQNGEEIIVEVRAYPIFDENKNVIQMLEACSDITEKKKAEEEKLHLERELNRASKLQSIGTLAAGVAHEINTPIQFIGDNTLFAEDASADLFEAISRYKALLEQISGDGVNIEQRIKQIDDDCDLEYLQDELPRALAQTKDGIDHVSKIVNAMKDFAHAGSETEMQYEDLNMALETTLTISKNEWKYIAELDKNLEATLPAVRCNIGEIKQVLLNLIVNAAHAIGAKCGNSGNKGRIGVTSCKEDDKVRISISDSGTGIDDVHKEHIFDPFYTTKEVRKGSGQGLSVAYQIIVEKHGGELWFETEMGVGSTFHVTLSIENPGSSTSDTEDL